MSWEKIKIGDICKIKHGYAFKGEYFTNSGQYILLTPGNFNESGGLKLKGEKEKYYSGEFPSEYLLEERDLLLVLTDLIQNAPILGGAAFIPESNHFLHNQRLGKVYNIDNEKIDVKYLYYVFNNEEYRGQVRGSATGATVRHTAPERIYKCQITIPQLSTQQKIASILSVYDDLIENNLKRVKLLEEAAQNIYKEWFVHFRFPGYEETEFENGLPKGWETATVYDIAEILSGGTPKTHVNSFWDGNIPFFTPKDATNSGFTYINRTEKYLTEEGLKNCNSDLYEKNTIFITARGTVGKICLAMLPMAMNQSCYALKSKTIDSQFFLCFALKELVGNIKKMAVGGVFDTIIVDTFKKISIIRPTNEIVKDFEMTVCSLMEQTCVLQLQIQKLTEARDILLPRLINRTIEV